MRRAFCALMPVMKRVCGANGYAHICIVCIREPAPGYAPGFAPVFGGRPERDYIADIRLLFFPAAGMSRAR
mgnify:CR=1 FL=1